MHSLKEQFIVENADMIIIVTNKLAESDQEMIYKILNYYREWYKRAKKATTQKYIYIVHNFKMLTSIEDVNNQIEKDIKKCFEVNKCPIFCTGNLEGNNNMYKDQYGVCHLVLASEGSEAGKYYNQTTVKFLKDRIAVTECKKKLNIVKAFQKFCNTHLPKMIGQEIQLEFDEKNSALVNTKGNEIKIDGIAWTSLGEVVTSGFKPNYSIRTRRLDDGCQEVIVDVEVIDCKRSKEPKPNTSRIKWETFINDGYRYLRLTGEKVLDRGATESKDQKNQVEFINYSRGEGMFDISISLIKNKGVKSSKSEELPCGITRFTFIFEDSLDENF